LKPVTPIATPVKKEEAKSVKKEEVKHVKPV